MEGLVHKGLEFRFVAQTLQQRIAHEVGITKESTSNAMPQHVQGRSLVAQHGIGLSNFVNALGVAYAALFNLAFRLLAAASNRGHYHA